MPSCTTGAQATEPAAASGHHVPPEPPQLHLERSPSILHRDLELQPREQSYLCEQLASGAAGAACAQGTFAEAGQTSILEHSLGAKGAHLGGPWAA